MKWCVIDIFYNIVYVSAYTLVHFCLYV